MELSEITQIIEEFEKKLKIIKDMLADYNVCNSDLSKSILQAAITKYVSQLTQQQ